MNKGLYLKKLIEESNLSITDISERSKVGRTTLYRWMDDPNLPLKKLLKISQVIGVDISIDFPTVIKIRNQQDKEALEEIKDKPIHDRYTALLEKHNETLHELMLVKEQLNEYKIKNAGTKSASDEGE